MPCYLIRMTHDIYVEADSPEADIEQLEAGLEDEPLYGPFDYDVVCETESLNTMLSAQPDEDDD